MAQMTNILYISQNNDFFVVLAAIQLEKFMQIIGKNPINLHLYYHKT